MKSLLIICLTIFSFGAFAGNIDHEIPVKNGKAKSTFNIFTLYTISMQADDFEVAEYMEDIQSILKIDLKMDKAQSENALYLGVEMKMDNTEFETTSYEALD